MRNMKLWLDLEETIIRSWSNPTLVNKELIRSFIKRNNLEEISIFSFAIWNDRDKKHFENYLKSWLEDVLHVTIVSFPSVEEMANTIFWKNGTVFDTVDFCSIWGKPKAFDDFVLMTEEAGTFVLIDDVVPTTTIHRIKRQQKVHLINVFELKENIMGL